MLRSQYEQTEDWSEGLSTYTQIFIPEKTGFSPVKILTKIFLTSVYLYSMQLFSAEPTIFSKKKIWFFTHENLKNGPTKLLIIGPNLFFHSRAQPTAHSQELIFHIMNMSQETSVSLSTYLQLPLRQWGIGNVYFLVLLKAEKANIAESPIAVMGL